MPEETNEDLPGFRPAAAQPGPDPLPGTSILTPGPQNPSADRPKISGTQDPGPSEGGPSEPRKSSTSSRTSSAEIDEALAGYGAGGFMVGSVALNKFFEKRTKTRTNRWLATEEETQAFGEALGRIASRRIPDELAEKGDTADYLILGEVVFNYGLRTVLNMTPEEAAAAGQQYIETQATQGPPPEGAQSPQYSAPPPTAPPPRQNAPASVQTADDLEGTAPAGTVHGVVAATPPPPSVISPGI